MTNPIALPLSPFISWLLVSLVVLVSIIGAWILSVFIALIGMPKPDNDECADDLINAKTNHSSDIEL